MWRYLLKKRATRDRRSFFVIELMAGGESPSPREEVICIIQNEIVLFILSRFLLLKTTIGQPRTSVPTVK